MADIDKIECTHIVEVMRKNASADLEGNLLSVIQKWGKGAPGGCKS
jgi:hypothetical protein